MKSFGMPILASLFLGLAARAETIQHGKVEFLAVTNVKMFRFTGTAKEFQAKIDRKGAQLNALEIRIPVSSLKTGMEIRDKHTVERVFTADGSTPDIVFTADKSSCGAGASPSEQLCRVNGQLSFRGQRAPFSARGHSRQRLESDRPSRDRRE